MKSFLQEFMEGRYGADALTTCMGIIGMIIALIGGFTHLQWLSWLAIIVIVLAIWRALSKNIPLRTRENKTFRSWTARVSWLDQIVTAMDPNAAPRLNQAAAQANKEEYERAKRTAKRMWKERKTTAFLKCPNCGQMLSVPKGKGHIRVTCPKCHTKIDTKS